MKIQTRWFGRVVPAPLLAAGAGLCLGLVTSGGEGPNPAEVRLEARRLEDQARELQAAGKEAEAQRVMNEVRELRGQFERTAPKAQERPAVAERRRELHQRRAELQMELQRRIEEGREQDADQLRRQIERVERAAREAGPEAMAPQPPRREGARLGRRGPVVANGPDRNEMRPPPSLRQPGRPGPVDPVRRAEHVWRAIENLRAAGLPELAERLEQGVRRMREQMGRGGPGGGPSEEVDRLRAEVRELREGMQEMKRRLEELARRGPGPERRGER